jgi:hypothetical protein
MGEMTHPSEQVDIETGVTGKRRGLLLSQSASQESPDPEKP